MRRKLIMLISLILLICIGIQVYFIEIVDTFPLSDAFIKINTVQDANNMSFLQDLDMEEIYSKYQGLTYQELEAQFTDDYHTLENEFLMEEENKLNKYLTGDENIKVIYLTKPGPDQTSTYYNAAGEFLKVIDGKVYVWQPLEISMMASNEVVLQDKIDIMERGEAIYIEAWIFENARSDTLNFTPPINGNFCKDTRPKVSDVAMFSTSMNDFEYKRESPENTEISIGGKRVKYIGARKDGRGGKNEAAGLNLVNGRIFDEPSNLVRISSGAVAYNSIGRSSNGDYNKVWNNQAYENFLKNSVNYLSPDTKCFGLQWKTGELFWSKDENRCKLIEDHGVNVSKGWPNGWRTNVYLMEPETQNSVDFQEDANLTGEEALSRRSTIKRVNNKILLLKDDI